MLREEWVRDTLGLAIDRVVGEDHGGVERQHGAVGEDAYDGEVGIVVY